jgi:hypothetical protein
MSAKIAGTRLRALKVCRALFNTPTLSEQRQQLFHLLASSSFFCSICFFPKLSRMWSLLIRG